MTLTAPAAKALALEIGYDAAGVARPHAPGAPTWARAVLVGLHATLDEAYDYEMTIEYAGRRKWHKPIYAVMESLSFQLAEALRRAGQRAEALTYAHSIDLMDLKRAAVEAGLGILGKNGLVVHRRFGPRVRFGAVFCDADWPTDRPLLDYYCSSCTQCWNACPTDALGPTGLDRARCIAEYNPTPEMAAQQDALEHRPSPCTRRQCIACITACPIGAREPAEFYRDIRRP